MVGGWRRQVIARARDVILQSALSVIARRGDGKVEGKVAQRRSRAAEVDTVVVRGVRSDRRRRSKVRLLSWERVGWASTVGRIGDGRGSILLMVLTRHLTGVGCRCRRIGRE